ncbi:MAG: TonB-dependent receptor [Burkholderiales bacterium]|nr:TonB-dependent receptor [Burkholderiales bacterium]
MMRAVTPLGSAFALACTLACAAADAANPAEVLELPQVEVVGTTPLPGSGIELRKLPANAQIFTRHDLQRQRSANLSDFLEDNATGVNLNAAQGNPFQPDVNFRGFTASPLLGTPQGVSVFFDGVRINEPFGDAVNWDLIPQSAIASIQIIPGSNPAFGLNTLGGAIALYSKSGASEYPQHPGGSITLSGGSFGRRTLGFETGGKHGPWDWFATGNDAQDAGWAEHNASHVRQVFAKLGWQDDRTDLDLTVSAADNRLEGTQTLPLSFTDLRAAYTYPDLTTNRAAAVAIKGSHAITDALLLSGNAYARRYRNDNLSSNVNANFGPTDPVQAHNDAALIDQTSGGLGVQLAYTGALLGLAHKVALGASIDQGRARYTRSTQPAAFTADRGTVALAGFVPETDADSTTRYLGAYASDSIDLDPRWTLTLAGRYNRADVRIADRSGSAPALNGAHRFTRFSPAVGLSFNPSPAWTTYASYNEGMRAPTAIELTCADPNAPCKLPNNFLADPPLKPIVSRTVEAGARGKLDADTRWSFALFRTELLDDLQFVSSNGVAINAGYFQNVGTTRRQGLELGASTHLGALALTAHYSYIDATYRTGFVENSPSNSSAAATGAIAVQPGDRLPSIPRHTLKLRAELQATVPWSIAAGALFASSVYARGDENNLDANGRVPGYTVLNLDTRYQLTRRLQLFARIDNVLDRRDANFGVLGDNVFTGAAQGFDAAHPRTEQFRGYGAPRGAWVGLQYTFE